MKLLLISISLIPAILFGQVKSINDLVNHCIIYSGTGEMPIMGFELNDSSTNYVVKINWGGRSTTNLMNFDNSGRLKFYRTYNSEANIAYSKNQIIVLEQPSTFSCSDSLNITSYTLNKDGFIVSSESVCNGSNLNLRYEYQLTKVGCVVSVFNKNKLNYYYVFIYDKDLNYFQWESIWDKTVVPKYKRDKHGIWSQFPMDVIYRQVMIKKTGEFDDKLVKDHYKNSEYEISDMTGKVIGKIEVAKTRIKSQTK